MTLKTKVAKISAATIIAATGIAVFGAQLDTVPVKAASSVERVSDYDVSESMAAEAEEALIIRAQIAETKRAKINSEKAEAKRIEELAVSEAKAAEEANAGRVQEQARAQEQEQLSQIAENKAPTQSVSKSPVVNSEPEVKTPAAQAPAAPVINSNVINVGLVGGQAQIDMCAGPVLFSPLPHTNLIAEHDGCGGWQRFGNLQAGSVVTLTGNINGAYKIGGKANVARGSNTDAIKNAFGGFPPVVFQTCIPGTNRMIITAAYPA